MLYKVGLTFETKLCKVLPNLEPTHEMINEIVPIPFIKKASDQHLGCFAPNAVHGGSSFTL